MYEVVSDDTHSSSANTTSSGGQYRIMQRLRTEVDCSLLVVCDQHIVLCREKRLISLTLTGEKER